MYVEKQNIMKIVGCFWTWQSFFGLFFSGFNVFVVCFVCLVKLQKCQNACFPRFGGFFGRHILVYLGLEGLGIFVFLVFAFLFRFCVCLFCSVFVWLLDYFWCCSCFDFWGFLFFVVWFCFCLFLFVWLCLCWIVFVILVLSCCLFLACLCFVLCVGVV